VALLAPVRAAERGLAALLLAALTVLVIVGSAFRYAGYPVIWSVELAQTLFIWVCVLAADITLQRYGHFSVDMLANALPASARTVLDVFNFVLVGVLLATLLYFGVKFAVVTAGRPMPIVGISQAFETAALPVGFALMLITTIEQLIARLGGQPLERPADEPREVL
jgi:TRAP-type C4-dicarboxylate transport system permease small subunit